MTLNRYFQNGNEICAMDAKQIALTGYFRKGYSDQDEFNQIWSEAQCNSEFGEEARDQVFEWTDYTIEIDIG